MVHHCSYALSLHHLHHLPHHAKDPIIRLVNRCCASFVGRLSSHNGDMDISRTLLHHFLLVELCTPLIILSDNLLCVAATSLRLVLTANLKDYHISFIVIIVEVIEFIAFWANFGLFEIATHVIFFI